MKDFILHSNGQSFLLIYFLFFVLIVFVTRLIIRNDGSSSSSIPEPTSVNPFELAFIRGGMKALLSLILFDLRKQGLVEMSGKGKVISFKRKRNNEKNISGIHYAIWNILDNKMDYRSIVRDSYGELYESFKLEIIKLEKSRLVANKKLKLLYQNTFIISVIILLLPGMAKLSIGIEKGKPVLFLIGEIVVFIFLLYLNLGRMKPIQTQLGKKFIKNAKRRFTWLQTKKSLTQKEELYRVAVFGVSKFKSKRSFPREYDSTSTWMWFSGGCSGCGSGCSGSNGCSGGSGCSSGCGSGCGGGGCGGCGS